MPSTPGLRERKKAARRRHLADVATELFLAQGFDAVTIADVAAAAEVARMTVTNYFPRKEDLLFDRHGAQLVMIADLVEQCPTRPLWETMRAHEEDLLAVGDPLSGLAHRGARFWSVVQDSPQLLARWEEHFRSVAGLLETAYLQRGLSAVQAEVAARTVAAAMQVVQTTPLRRAATTPYEEVLAAQPRVIAEAFEPVQRGLARLHG